MNYCSLRAFIPHTRKANPFLLVKNNCLKYVTFERVEVDKNKTFFLFFEPYIFWENFRNIQKYIPVEMRLIEKYYT